MKIGVVAFPLSRGKETGRGLDRTFEEIATGFVKIKVDFRYYDLGFIPKEWQAIFKSPKFFNMLKKTKDDIYLAVYPVSAIFPILAGKRPVVVGIHDMIPFHLFGYNNRLKYAFKRWAIKFAATRSDHIIVGLATTKKEIIEYFKVPASKISVVPYGIDPKVYFLDKKIKKEPYKIAFLGEAKRAKGMDTAIKAFAIVRKKFPEAKLVLASSGAEFEKMKRLAESTLPANSYDFAGFIPENKMRQFYASADVFVFPSRHGFGLSALEAMACGTPAIVGDTLDARDFFTDEDMLSDPNDPEMLAEKINNLFDDRNLYNQKCKEALSAVKGFTWEKTSKGYNETCMKISEENKLDKEGSIDSDENIIRQREHYAIIAGGFDKRYNRENSNHFYKIEEIEKAFLKYLPPKSDGWDFMEVGAGSGIHAKHFLQSLGDKVKSMLLNDLSAEMLELAKKRLAEYPNTEYLACPAEEILTNKKFDGIFVSGSMHHFSDYKRSISEIKSRLKPNGVVVICEPNVWNPINFIKAVKDLSLEKGQFSVTKNNVNSALSEQYLEPLLTRVLHFRAGNSLVRFLCPYKKLEKIKALDRMSIMFLSVARNHGRLLTSDTKAGETKTILSIFVNFFRDSYYWLEKSYLGKGLRFFVSASLVAYLAFSINWSAVLQTFRSLNVLIILPVFIISVIVEVFSIKRHQLILRQMNSRVSFRQMTKFYFFGIFASLFLPAGADISKFLLLKSKGNIGLKISALSLVHDRLFGLSALLAVLSGSVVIAGVYSFPIIDHWMIWISSIYIVGLIITYVLLLRIKRKDASIYIKCFFLSLLYQFSVASIIYLIGFSMNANVPVMWYFLLVPVIALGSMLPISVGGLGIREWLLISFASYLGLTREAALSISLILWLFMSVEGIFGVIVYYPERKKK